MKKRPVLVAAVASMVLALGVIAVILAWSSRASKVSYAATNLVTPSATTTLVTGVAVQNLSNTSPATIVIDFYNQSGSLISGASISAIIDPGSQRSFYTPDLVGLPSPFIGSAVVSSDQPVLALLNTQTPSAGGTSPSDPFRIGGGLGESAPTPKKYAPQVMKNYYGWNSAIYAQNASTSAANVTFTLIDKNGVTKDTQTFLVQPSAMKDLRQATEAALPDGFVGSAVVESTANLAIIVNFFSSNTDYTTSQYMSYNAISGGGTKLYVPRLVRKYYDYNGGFKVQNIGTLATRIRVTYYIGSSIGVQQTTGYIQPNQAWGPYMGDDAQVPAGLSSGTGSAIIESLDGQPLVAIVNEDNRILGRGATYNAIVDGSQTTTLFLPQITARFYGFSSGLQFQNVGSSPASGTITFNKAGNPPIVIPFSSVGPGQSFSFFAPNASGGTLTDFNGAAVIQTSNSQPIVGIGNQSFRADYDPRWGNKYGDSYSMVNALNK